MKFIKRVSSSFGLVMGPLSQAAPKLRRLAVGALLAALVAHDSHGRTSLARMSLGVEVDGGALSSLADDAQAVSPLTTFPTLTQQKKLTADDGATFDQFGAAVAVSGDTAVVGAPEDVDGNSPGAAYVFVRSGGVWTKQQKLAAEEGAAIEGVGFAVAISGDTVVIGAETDDIGEKINQGSAYVFARSGGAWTQRQKLTADDGAANDGFGFSVAISGDTVVVSARSKSVGQGAAYVFTRSLTPNGATWTQQQQLTADDGEGGDAFGHSVAVSGDTVVVGASLATIGANSDQGSAYVFVRSGAVWTKQQKLTADDGAAGDQLGSSVAITGDTIVMGAPLDDVGSKSDQGAAYVFVRSGTVWTKQQKLTADDGEALDSFGASVAFSSDTVVVGAPGDKIGENIVQGSAYVFVRSLTPGGATWMKQQKLTADDGAVGDQLGSSVAISGDTVVVGAPGDEIGEN